ncbi:MAG TPA: HlyD family efflux transporter periplasmic adaptor subunit [Vicinamibacteria bacterium]|nr:HlyD family efflux transporter periplasmic adaptor subunit [Vicinamibacteria bacterium]
MRSLLVRVLGHRRSLGIAGVLALVAILGARLVRSIEPDPVATFEVRPGRFVREVEATGTLKAVKATPVIVPPESGRAQKVAFLAKDGAHLAKGDTVVEFDPYDAQKEAADGEADLTAARARIDKAKAEGTKNERSLGLDRDVAKEQLDRAETFKLTDEGLFSRHQIIESQLDRDLFAARADVAGRKLDASGKLSSAERALGEIDAGKAKLKVDVAEKGLRSLRIEAPHDGLLVLERNWRGEVPFVGDTLWPGQKVAELPDLSKLEARVFVLEADGAGLKAGLPARLAIEGRPGEGHPATVTKVEPLAKTRDYQSPVKYFEATLSLARTDPSFMKPGQKVRAVVRLEEAEGVLAIPRGAVFEKDGKRVVFRREKGAFVPVEVTIGRQSISRVVLDSGLAAGDVIALRDPTAKRALGPPAAGGAEAGK